MRVGFDPLNLHRQAPGAAGNVLLTPRIETESAPRDVVRCQECRLVQFRTKSDHCRRCAMPLPSLLPYELAQEAAADCAGDRDLSETEESLPEGRAARNRRVSVGAKLKELREERGLTQIKMSALLGIPRSYLSRIENRRLLPGPLMVAKFAEALQIPISELLPPERRRDGSRLFPHDAALAVLYSRIAGLPVEQLGRVLAVVRKMAAGKAGLRPNAAPAAARSQLVKPAAR